MNISFTSMTFDHINLWEKWITYQHVREVWFIEGYEPASYIYEKIKGNGYDYPFIIYLDNKPIGYISCCDLYSYRTICSNPKGLFTNEDPGTYCMDLFIAEEDYLNKGYGTKIVQDFSQYIFDHFGAQKILIDPAVTNKRAIRCYEKAGFTFIKEAFDGVMQCHILEISKNCDSKI